MPLLPTFPQIDTREPDSGWQWFHSPLVAIEVLEPNFWHLQTAYDAVCGVWLSVSVEEYGGADHTPQLGEMVSWYGGPFYAIKLTVGERLIFDHSGRHLHGDRNQASDITENPEGAPSPCRPQAHTHRRGGAVRDDAGRSVGGRDHSD